MTVYIVHRYHRSYDAEDCVIICGAFTTLKAARACLKREYQAVRPEPEWIFTEQAPDKNSYRACIVQTDDDMDEIVITPKKVE